MPRLHPPPPSNDTSCLCSDAFSTTAKACLYSSGCSTDVGTFFSYQTAQCGDLVDTYTYASAATAAAVSSATSTSTTSSPASKLSNAASGGIGAGVTVAVLAALLAALYAGGLVRFGKQRSAVALDSASVTSSEVNLKGSQRIQVRLTPSVLVARRVARRRTDRVLVRLPTARLGVVLPTTPLAKPLPSPPSTSVHAGPHPSVT